MKFEQLVIGVGLLSVMGLPMLAEAKDSKSITLKQIGRYSAGGTTTRAEISAYDPGSKRLFSVNLALQQLDILDLSNPESQVLATVGTVALGGNPNSVAVHDGIVKTMRLASWISPPPPSPRSSDSALKITL